jgi:polysaccharide export outer membrane protein
MTSLQSLLLALVASALLLLGCSTTDWSDLPPLPQAPNTLTPAARTSTAETLAAFRRVGEAHSLAGYRLGAGDLVSVNVWEREDLSGPQIVGPDGNITLPVVGDVKIGGLNRTDALGAIQNSLARAYQNLVITLRVDEYNSMRVTVVGQVNSPGVQEFDSAPHLLDAIGAAGGVDDPADGLTTSDLPLSVAAANRQWKAAIVRGSDTVLWVDLNALLRDGDLSLNVPLIAGDIVHVSGDILPMIYVLGEVASPGIYPMRAGATIIDALALAGGTTDDSDDEEVRLLRPTQNQVGGFDYQAYQVGELEFDQKLAAGDVIYVPTSIIGEIGYFLNQISPLGQILIFTGLSAN